MAVLIFFRTCSTNFSQVSDQAIMMKTLLAVATCIAVMLDTGGMFDITAYIIGYVFVHQVVQIVCFFVNFQYIEVDGRLHRSESEPIWYERPYIGDEHPGSAPEWNGIPCRRGELKNGGSCNCNDECPPCAPVCTPFGFCHRESPSGSIYHCPAYTTSSGVLFAAFSPV